MANFQIRLDQEIAGTEIKNITYWQLPDNSPTTLQEFADALRASYITAVTDTLSESWSLQHLTVRQMDGGGAFTFTQPFTSGALLGTNNGQRLPNLLSLLVSTGFVGPRPNRGRIYFGGFTEDQNAGDGQWGAGVATTFQNLVTGWANGLSTTNGACFLRIARPDYATNTWTLNNAVETVVGRQKTATQRGRIPE